MNPQNGELRRKGSISDMTVGIPADASEISAAWLHEFSGIEIEMARVSAIKGQGSLARVFRIEGPAEPLILKLPLHPDDPWRPFGEVLDVWRRESRFYAEVGPMVAVRVPRVYGNCLVSEKESILLLEDLRASGFTGGAQRDIGVGELQGAVDWLARLHRTSLPPAAMHAVPHDGGPTSLLLQREFRSRWHQFRIGELGGRQSPSELDALERRSNDSDAILDRIRRTGSTFRHGDACMANLFFSDDLGEVAGIDWQMCSVGVGAHDLASLLASTAHLAVPSLSEMIDCYTEVSGSERNTVEHDLRQVVVLVLMAIVASGPALIDGLGPEQREAQVIAVARAFELAAALDFDQASADAW